MRILQDVKSAGIISRPVQSEPWNSRSVAQLYLQPQILSAACMPYRARSFIDQLWTLIVDCYTRPATLPPSTSKHCKAQKIISASQEALHENVYSVQALSDMASVRVMRMLVRPCHHHVHQSQVSSARSAHMVMSSIASCSTVFAVS